MLMRYPNLMTWTSPSNTATQVGWICANLDGTWAASGSFDLRQSVVTAPFEMDGLSMTLSVAPGVGITRTFTVMKNNVATGITQSFANTTTTTANTTKVSFGIGDKIHIQATVTGGTAAAAGTVDGYTTFIGRDQQILAGNSTNMDGVNTTFLSMQGGIAHAQATTAPIVYAVMPCAGTFSMLHAMTPAGGPGAGESYQINLYVNGANSALQCSISGTAIVGTDYVNEVTVAAGDLVCIRAEPIINVLVQARALTYSMRFAPAEFGKSVLLYGSSGALSTTAARYINPYGQGNAAPATTETTADVDLPAGVTLDALYVDFTTAPDNGAGTDTYTVRTRINAANNGPVAVVSETATTANDSTNSTVSAAGDMLSVSATPANTPAAPGNVHLGVLMSMDVISEGFVDVSGAELGTASAPYYGGAMLFAGSTLPTVATNKVRTGTYSYRTSVATTGTSYFVCHGTDPDNHPSIRGHYLDTAFYATHFNYTTKATTASGEQIAQFVDTAGAVKASLRLKSDGTITVYNSAGTLVATGATVLAADTWYRLEFKCGTGASGAYELQIDGVSEVSGTTNLLTTRNAKGLWGKVANSNGDTVDYNYDDLWVSDTGFQTKGYKVALVVPNAAGASQDWTASTDTPKDYTQINEVPPNGTTEIASKLVGAAFSVALGSAPASIIKCVKQLGYFADGASNTIQVILRLRTSSTNYDNGAYDVDTTEQPLAHVYNTDVSGAAWTSSVFDGAEVGAITDRSAADATGCSWMGVLVLYEQSTQNNLLLLGVS